MWGGRGLGGGSGARKRGPWDGKGGEGLGGGLGAKKRGLGSGRGGGGLRGRGRAWTGREVAGVEGVGDGGSTLPPSSTVSLYTWQTGQVDSECIATLETDRLETKQRNSDDSGNGNANEDTSRLETQEREVRCTLA